MEKHTGGSGEICKRRGVGDRWGRRVNVKAETEALFGD